MTGSIFRTLAAGAGALALATASQAIAQSAAAPASAPIPAAAGAPSVESTSIGDLLANPAAKAVLEKDMPQLVSYPGLDQIKDMTLRAISVYPEAQLDDAKLKSIQADLNSAAATKP
ncbi:MAG TPA: hypothetical protein VK801_00975 [Caulobacteraceae bacterium]|jgi:hypothetical protein|nr:hypothetical protein [Caulobacteraceae bacterium]